MLEKTCAIAKLIEDSRFWQVSGDIRELVNADDDYTEDAAEDGFEESFDEE